MAVLGSFIAAILQPKRMSISRHDTGVVYLLLRERGDRTKLSLLRELFFGVLAPCDCFLFGTATFKYLRVFYMPQQMFSRKPTQHPKEHEGKRKRSRSSRVQT